MNPLSYILIIKIAATISAWSIPLILFPAELLKTLGFPPQETYMFARMLGWAYLALCVGYAFCLQAALQGERLMGPIWVGVVSNGGGCIYLIYYGLSGAWQDWGLFVQVILWGSIVATAIITAGLLRWGVFGQAPIRA